MKTTFEKIVATIVVVIITVWVGTIVTIAFVGTHFLKKVW
jgi:hypothetical protein